MYNFTELAVQLNEPEPGVAPSDSRLRPDQRLMEDAKWDEANDEKLRLEEKQRTARKQREAAAASLASTAGSTSENSEGNQLNELTASDHEPAWFKKRIDPYTNQPIHVSNNEYWACKEKQDWKRCPDLY